MTPTSLTDTQVRTLTALIDRIIPADDYPSASQAGVVNYIQRLLARSELPNPHKLLSPLSTVDILAMARTGRNFPQLSPRDQDQFLKSLEVSGNPGMRQLFKLLVDLTIEGYYADSSNGANLDHASWKMLGYQPRLHRDGESA